jgi:hypothetical protein
MPSSRDSRDVAKAGRLAIHPVAKSLRRYDLTGRGRPREAAPGSFLVERAISSLTVR